MLPELIITGKIETDLKKIVIDYELLGKLCSIGCGLGECAAVMSTTPLLLSKKIKEEKGVTFHEFQNLFTPGLKATIRRKQLEVAQAGNVAMLKWLGIQYLGQSEKGSGFETDGGVEIDTEKLLEIVRREDVNKKEGKRSYRNDERIRSKEGRHGNGLRVDTRIT